MSNEVFLETYKNSFESLKYFSIKDNTLILNYNGVFMMGISHINLAMLNTNLFLLTPEEIYQTLYMIELLYRDNVSSYETNFATSYVNNYLALNDNVLSNTGDDTGLLELRVSILGMPISLAYEDSFNNKPISTLIQNTLNNHTNDLESGKSKGPKLVRLNPNGTIYENENELEYLKSAGFTALFLIILGVLLTVGFVFFFVINH